ncbi:MAG: hypothetical protein M0P64_03115 [Candidatus Pacebacteria bacterium]|nr:hypothetical protein [Candidatus Paceibacterota bacterium]
MKNLVLFIAAFSIVAFSGGIELALAFTLAVAAIVYVMYTRLTVDLSEFYRKLPTSWQDISETLELANDSKFFEDGIDSGAIFSFYEMLSEETALFDLRVDFATMNVFEKKYDAALFKYHTVSPMLRASIHYGMSLEKNPERLPDIAGALLIRKRPQGRLMRVKDFLLSLTKPVFN